MFSVAFYIVISLHALNCSFVPTLRGPLLWYLLVELWQGDPRCHRSIRIIWLWRNRICIIRPMAIKKIILLKLIFEFGLFFNHTDKPQFVDNFHPSFPSIIWAISNCEAHWHNSLWVGITKNYSHLSGFSSFWTQQILWCPTIGHSFSGPISHRYPSYPPTYSDSWC